MAFNLINFKKGTLTGLNSLKSNSGIEEGTFYLTIDENKQTSRLYIGTGATTALPVNSNITVVTKATDLTDAHAANFNDGDFAYVTTGNILAVKYNKKWTQINAVNEDNIISTLTPTISTENNVATINWDIRMGGGSIIPQGGGGATGEGVTADHPHITITGADGVTVSNSGSALTISGDPYQLSSAAVAANTNTATISLAHGDSYGTNAGSVSISAGNNVEIAGTANNIVISAEDTQLKNVVGAAAASGTGFTVTVTDTADTTKTGTIDPKITLGAHTAAADQYSFTNGVANLPVYTKDEIDNMNKALDALVYRGTVGTGGTKAPGIGGIITGETPALGQDPDAQHPGGIKIGFTYKLTGDATTAYDGIPTGGNTSGTAYGGDLIIANGTEGADGFITSGSLYYDIVPSGDEKYVFKGLGLNGTGNGIQIEDGNDIVLASIGIGAGNQIAVSSTHTGTNGEKAEITIAHGTISASTNGNANTPGLPTAANTQVMHNPLTINAVTGLTTNNGHVTAVEVTPFKVVDTLSQLGTNTALTIDNTVTNVAKITSKIQIVDEEDVQINYKDLAFDIRSDNLSITSPTIAGDSTPHVQVNFVWGTFGE